MTQHGGIAVIFWGPHSICTENFAIRLHAPFYPIHYLRWKEPLLAPIKYIPMWLKTWFILLRQRPSSVFVVNTPVFAPLCVYMYCRLAGIPFVMNVHGHTLSGRKWGWSRPLQRFLGRRALVNLVGTLEYLRIFESWGAKSLLLEDPPIDLPGGERVPFTKPNGFILTVISTFAGDEPLHLVVDAARQLAGIRFYILGDTALADKRLLASAPSNVVFPGYLKGDAYWNQLYFSRALMILTTNPYSLVAGGIEGMVMGKPLILSRQPALVDYFTKGTIFVDHTIDSITVGINEARAHEGTLAKETADLAVEKRDSWERSFQGFLSLLGGS